MVRIQKMRPLAFKLISWEFFEYSEILLKISNSLFGKRSSRTLVFFSWTTTDKLDLQTGLRSTGLTVLEKCDFPMKVDDCAQAHNSHWQIFFKLHLIWLCYGKDLVFCKTMILTKRGYLHFSGNIFDINFLYNKIVKLEIQLC